VLIDRIARAVAGWAPIALGIGWLAGEITGCGRFSASCDSSEAPIAWLAQVVVLAGLLLVPRLATVAAIATVATLAAAVPGALLLSATGGSADLSSGRDILAGILVVAWAAGLAAGLWRALGHPAGGGRPVS
nr:hypothetical protein [Chloroflexota bacterium]